MRTEGLTSQITNVFSSKTDNGLPAKASATSSLAELVKVLIQTG